MSSGASSGPVGLRNNVTLALRSSSSSCPIEFSKVRGADRAQAADCGRTPQARASAEKTRAAARDPVILTTRRSGSLSGLRKGEQVTWFTRVDPEFAPRSTEATYVVWTSPLRIVIVGGRWGLGRRV